jgi:hypothetical protein
VYLTSYSQSVGFFLPTDALKGKKNQDFPQNNKLFPEKEFLPQDYNINSCLNF